MFRSTSYVTLLLLCFYCCVYVCAFLLLLIILFGCLSFNYFFFLFIWFEISQIFSVFFVALPITFNMYCIGGPLYFILFLFLAINIASVVSVSKLSTNVVYVMYTLNFFVLKLFLANVLCLGSLSLRFNYTKKKLLFHKEHSNKLNN